MTPASGPGLETLDHELVPPAVIQRAGQGLGPPGRGITRVLSGDALLQERSGRGPVIGGPGVDRLPELVPDLIQPVGRVPCLMPDQLQLLPVDVGRDSSSSFMALTSASAARISSCSVPATSLIR